MSLRDAWKIVCRICAHGLEIKTIGLDKRSFDLSSCEACGKPLETEPGTPVTATQFVRIKNLIPGRGQA